jgi:hypothetical protein
MLVLGDSDMLNLVSVFYVLQRSSSVLPRSGFVSQPRVASTLGHPCGDINPEGVASLENTRSGFAEAQVATPSGLKTSESLPRVDVKARQPWALRRNRFAVQIGNLPTLLTGHA